MRKLSLATGILAIAALCCVPASAAGVLYSNGPINGDLTAYFINAGSTLAVADSFTLTSNSVLTGVDFGAWVPSGGTPASVQWGISNAPDYGSGLGGGTASTLTNTLFCTNSLSCGENLGYDVYTSSFALPSVALPAGTYYLTLQNGDPAGLGWDQNNGPSVAYDSGLPGNLNGYFGAGTNSETFDITGTAATPEPGSMALVGSALIGAAALLWRKAAKR
jgi:hypothetical protein